MAGLLAVARPKHLPPFQPPPGPSQGLLLLHKTPLLSGRWDPPFSGPPSRHGPLPPNRDIRCRPPYLQPPYHPVNELLLAPDLRMGYQQLLLDPHLDPHTSSLPPANRCLLPPSAPASSSPDCMRSAHPEPRRSQAPRLLLLPLLLESPQLFETPHERAVLLLPPTKLTNPSTLPPNAQSPSD